MAAVNLEELNENAVNKEIRMELQDLDFYKDIDSIMDNFESTRFNERQQELDGVLAAEEAVAKNQH